MLETLARWSCLAVCILLVLPFLLGKRLWR